MMTNTLDLKAERGGRWIRLRGDLNYATVDEASVDLRAALSAAKGPVVLDLRAVGLLASMGIEALLTAAKSAPGGRLILLVNPFVEDVLKVARVTQFFTVTRIEQEAVHAAGF